MAERHSRILARISELGLSLAERTHEQAMEAGTPEAAAGYGLSFQRAARAVRQTVALEARLHRDLRALEKDDAAEARRAGQARIDRRHAQVRATVGQLIWNEYDSSEAERLESRLDDRLDEEALYDGFTDETVEAHIARLCAELGLAAEPAPTAPSSSDPDDDEDYWRSSA